MEIYTTVHGDIYFANLGTGQAETFAFLLQSPCDQQLQLCEEEKFEILVVALKIQTLSLLLAVWLLDPSTVAQIAPATYLPIRVRKYAFFMTLAKIDFEGGII